MAEVISLDLADLSADVRALGAAIRSFAKVSDIALTESLKWGQPSFAPPRSTGTPVRIGESAGRPAVFVHCTSPVVAQFLGVVPDAMTEGTRAFFPDGADDPALPVFLSIAFGYRKFAKGAPKRTN